MKKWCFLLLIITFSLTVSAETEDFFLKTEKDTVTIGLNIKDFQMVQLFRKENEKSPVNIFEFSAPGSTFSENADSDNCYFIKVYKNSETPFVSEEKCVSETYFIGRIETALIIFLILLVFSFFAPRFIPFRFLTYETDKPEKTISETIKILAGEDSKSVLIHSSSDWIGDPVNIAVSSFLNRSLDEGQENVMTTYFNDLTFVRSDREKLFKKVLLINGQRPFLTSIIRNAVPRSAIFHITENNPESSLDSFKDRKDRVFFYAFRGSDRPAVEKKCSDIHRISDL